MKQIIIIFLSMLTLAMIPRPYESHGDNHDPDLSECHHKCFHDVEKCSHSCEDKCKLAENKQKCLNFCFNDCIGGWVKCATKCDEEEEEDGYEY